MTPQEQAFHDWDNSQETFGYNYLEIWNAACAWQRKHINNLVYKYDDDEEYYLTESDYRNLFNEYDQN